MIQEKMAARMSRTAVMAMSTSRICRILRRNAVKLPRGMSLSGEGSRSSPLPLCVLFGILGPPCVCVSSLNYRSASGRRQAPAMKEGST